jgi:hypothetical protein
VALGLTQKVQAHKELLKREAEELIVIVFPVKTVNGILSQSGVEDNM